MLENIGVFNAASARMSWSDKRHELITNNIAHADTPDYTGKDLKPFSLTDPSGTPQKATRPTHLNFDSGTNPYLHNEAGATMPFDETIDHNGVSVEEEVGKAAEAVSSHAFGAAVWTKSLSMLNLVLGGRG
jgi:flagellar basal-body rod protein FlgB